MFPGLPTIQLLQAIKNWTVGRPGNEAILYEGLGLGFHAYMPFVTAGLADPNVPGLPNEEELTRMYAALMKLPHPLPHWEFFKALSCFRMAAVVQV